MSEWMGPVGRRESTDRFGAITMDRVHPHWDCARCGASVRDPNVYTVGTVLYSDLERLKRDSRQALAIVQPPQCCGADAVLRASDYHAYQGEPGVDLVLRWKRDAGEPELWWWDGEAYVPAEPDEELDGEIVDSMSFLTDAVFRKAASRMETEGVEAALDDIVICRQDCPGLPEILWFVLPLAKAGHGAMAKSIVEMYLEENPDDENATELLEKLDEEFDCD